ncbi:hypothetical protein BBP40_004345 [Aspergillus hancockii]|nr:hypothetical protein BBP40_004345 [Aspergillus hancockii]
MHAQNLLPVAASISTAIANQTVSLFLPEFQGQSLVGKVIGTDGAQTTYVVNCNPRPKNQGFYEIGDCEGTASGFTVTHGPSTFRAVFDYPQYTLAEDCSISASTSVSCDLTMDYGSSSTVDNVATVGPIGDFYQTLTVTTTEIPSDSATTKASATPTTATPTPSMSDGQKKANASTASSTTPASQSTNAAFAVATGNVIYAVGGAAAMAMVAIV